MQFISEEKKDEQVVKKDTWNMLYELIESTKGDFANYVDDGAWPSLIDQFNEFYQKKYASKWNMYDSEIALTLVFWGK